MFLMIPDNTVTIEKESFQALTQCSVVAGIVSRDAKQIIGDVVLFENLMDNFGKIGTSVTSINLFESKERLMKAKLFVDIMRSNTYTGLVNINRSDGMRCNPEKMSRLPITLERCTQECNMTASWPSVQSQANFHRSQSGKIRFKFVLLPHNICFQSIDNAASLWDTAVRVRVSEKRNKLWILCEREREISLSDDRQDLFA